VRVKEEYNKAQSRDAATWLFRTVTWCVRVVALWYVIYYDTGSSGTAIRVLYEQDACCVTT
jgi:hypothetical protein